MKARVGLAVLALAGLGTAAAGVATGEPDPTARPDAAPRRTVEVRLTEWRIHAGAGRVRAGRVTFEETNAGREEHDLLIVRTDLPPDDLPAGLEGVAPELAGRVVLGEAHRGHTHGGGSAHHHLRSGARRSRSVTLEPGRYVVLCPIPGHYERGQRTVLTVR